MRDEVAEQSKVARDAACGAKRLNPAAMRPQGFVLCLPCSIQKLLYTKQMQHRSRAFVLSSQRKHRECCLYLFQSNDFVLTLQRIGCDIQ
ncbi:hypothetical protein PsorP6_009474 [Peronosclerospora sorghi]|uniref:Uncharacterized protein n=1 Tax=Peronosclerospora sorghi TaxID=230839 RepID=A0ACC0W0X8_9STRA|nr:hypothetical protein PsorP6_009474 [Peronosclerospora sorghi]